MKALNSLIIILLVSASVFAQKYRVPVIASANDFGAKVYIDPNAPEGGNGTKGSPFNSWQDVQIKSNTAYLFKAGTTFEGEISGSFSNNYIGMYGEGLHPVIRRLGVAAGTNGLTVNEIDIIKEGFVWQMVALSEQGDGPTDVTIANCLIKGIDNGNGYPHRNIQGKCNGLVLYHNEICYSVNDGIYLATYAPNTTIVSNYFHHNNMGGVEATNSAGDGIQIEMARCSNTYIANNYIDRKETNWKFSFIVNSLIDQQSNVVCEWNTFVSPKKSSAGGTSVRWLGGTNNIYRKNLIDSWAGLPGIDTYDAHANQPEPYGIRDNIEYGPNIHCAKCKSKDNLDFKTKEEYLNYISDNGLEEYGSDLDINNFWSNGGINIEGPCASTNITVTPTIVNDTNNMGVGYIETEISGANGKVACKWSNGEKNQDIYNLTSGSYSLTITDDESCTKYVTYNVKNEYKQEEVIVKGHKLNITNATASNDDGNIASNMIDGDKETRWSSSVNEVAAIFTFDSSYIVNNIKIATFKGDQRSTEFDVYASLDGENWEKILDLSTSGMTNDLETYTVSSTVAKYIKIVGYGNNSSSSKEWTSVSEFEAWGESNKNQEEDICLSTTITITGTIISDTNQLSVGAIETAVSGANGDVTYSWSNSKTTENIYNLYEGAYTLVVTDTKSCTETKTFQVNNIIVEVIDPCEKANIKIKGMVVDDSNNSGIGAIETNIEGTTGEISYNWSNGETTENIYNLSKGNYTLTIIDGASCSVTKTFEIINIFEQTEVTIDGYKLNIVAVQAEGDDGNLEENMIDNDLNTRWSSDIDAVKAIFTLDSVSIVNNIKIATYKGDQRNNILEIHTSEDGTDWVQVLDLTTSGKTSGFETYKLTSTKAKYVKIIGLGNNDPQSQEWTSITEFEVYGKSVQVNDNDGNGENPDEDSNTSIDVKTVSIMKAYPNPVYQGFTVSVSEPGLMQIINTNSSCIFTKEIEKGKNEITFDFPSAGIYILKVTFKDGEIRTQELMVKL